MQKVTFLHFDTVLIRTVTYKRF